MEKRTLIALALSFMVLGLYPLVLQKFYPNYYNKKPVSSSQGQANVTATAAASAGRVSEKLVKAGDFSADEDVALKNSDLALVFNKKDGGIRAAAFPRFVDSETSRPIQFISLKSLGVSTGSLLVTSGADSSLVTDFAGEASGDQASFSSSVLDRKIAVTKSFSFDGESSGKLKVRLENTTDAPFDLSYELIVGSGVTARHSIDEQYIEANFFSQTAEKKILKHIKENRVGKIVTSAGSVEWVAVKDRHFSIIMKPDTAGAFTGLVRGLGAHDFAASLVSQKITLQPRSSVEHEFLVYIGPNEIEPLEKLGLGDIVNFGKFDMIGKLFVGALELLQKLCRNYGLAIILLTTLINLILFPLTRVSYMSMKRMQLIQPQMNKLKEHHK